MLIKVLANININKYRLNTRAVELRSVTRAMALYKTKLNRSWNYSVISKKVNTKVINIVYVIK